MRRTKDDFILWSQAPHTPLSYHRAVLQSSQQAMYVELVTCRCGYILTCTPMEFLAFMLSSSWLS